MSYYIYENWTHNKARLHKSGCGYCNDGNGTQPADSGRNGKWHGPFEDLNIARRALIGTNKNDTADCGNCKP